MDSIVLDALGDRTRRRIVAFLANQEACVSDIVKEVALAQPTVSQHLKVLREAHLVSVTARAQQRLYCLDREELAAAAMWMLRISGFWNERLDALEAQLAATPIKGKRHG
jgi:DNA-binding transcriptional ArsR family regulator